MTFEFYRDTTLSVTSPDVRVRATNGDKSVDMYLSSEAGFRDFVCLTAYACNVPGLTIGTLEQVKAWVTEDLNVRTVLGIDPPVSVVTDMRGILERGTYWGGSRLDGTGISVTTGWTVRADHTSRVVPFVQDEQVVWRESKMPAVKLNSKLLKSMVHYSSLFGRFYEISPVALLQTASSGTAGPKALTGLVLVLQREPDADFDCSVVSTLQLFGCRVLRYDAQRLEHKAFGYEEVDGFARFEGYRQYVPSDAEASLVTRLVPLCKNKFATFEEFRRRVFNGI